MLIAVSTQTFWESVSKSMLQRVLQTLGFVVLRQSRFYQRKRALKLQRTWPQLLLYASVYLGLLLS